jgi:hypothetical protein
MPGSRKAVANARLGMIVQYMELARSGSDVDSLIDSMGFAGRQSLHNFRHVIRKYHGLHLPRLRGERGGDKAVEAAGRMHEDSSALSFVLVAG